MNLQYVSASLIDWKLCLHSVSKWRKPWAVGDGNFWDLKLFSCSLQSCEANLRTYDKFPSRVQIAPESLIYLNLMCFLSPCNTFIVLLFPIEVPE